MPKYNTSYLKNSGCIPVLWTTPKEWAYWMTVIVLMIGFKQTSRTKHMEWTVFITKLCYPPKIQHYCKQFLNQNRHFLFILLYHSSLLKFKFYFENFVKHKDFPPLELLTIKVVFKIHNSNKIVRLYCISQFMILFLRDALNFLKLYSALLQYFTSFWYISLDTPREYP